MRYIKSIFEIIDNYDCIFCDINGVLTGGFFLFYGVKNALEHLKKLGKHIVFISNATRTQAMVKAQLITLGVEIDMLGKIVTSGDVLRYYINYKLNEFKNLDKGNKFYVLGNINFLEGINDIQLTMNIQEANYVLLNGVVSDVRINEPNIYNDLLKRNVPLICTNPDKVALNGDSFMKTPNYAAAKYRKLGGAVYSYGKPYKIIYDRAFEMYPGLKNLRVICIGDTLMTDIKGANDYGLDSIFLTSGISKRIIKERTTISSFFAEHGIIPTYYTECFS